MTPDLIVEPRTQIFLGGVHMLVMESYEEIEQLAKARFDVGEKGEALEVQSGGLVRLTMVQEGVASRVMINPNGIIYALDIPPDAREAHRVKP